VIDGVRRIRLRRFDDERGWFTELMRSSQLPKPVRQSNLAWSRRGVIRALHYHERGQDDLFVCLQGTARVVVLDLESGETFCEDIGDENPVGVYVPGRYAHGFEAITELLFCYHVTEEYDPADPDEHEVPWDDPRVRDLWSIRSPILSARDASAASKPAPVGNSARRSPRCSPRRMCATVRASTSRTHRSSAIAPT